jgi:hypothetical protein
MNSEQLVMSNEKRKCTDCLHCKVYASSTEECRLCFCVVIGRKAILNELYWRNKSVCQKFSDMAS